MIDAAQSLGWIVVTALWEGALIAGVAALLFAALRRSAPIVRERVGVAALALIAVAPLVSVWRGADLTRPGLNRLMTESIDRFIGVPAYLNWRAFAVGALGAIWIAGLAIGLVRIAVSWQRLRLMRRRAADAGGDIAATIAGLCRNFGVKAAVSAGRSTDASVPMLVGAARPLILLPPTTIDALSPEGLRSILAHEVAHVARHDFLANAVQVFADAALFFHPAARWLSNRIRIEREFGCDDVAMTVIADRSVYARALAFLDDARDDSRFALAASSGVLVDRIARMAGREAGILRFGRALSIFAASALAAAIVFVSAFAIPSWLPPGTQMRKRAWPGPGAPPQPRGAMQRSLPRSPSR